MNKDELIKKIDLINSKNIKINIFEVTREVLEIEKNKKNYFYNIKTYIN